MRRGLSAIVLAVVVVGWPGTATAQELPPGGTFTDDNGNRHEGYIEAIAAEGITLGCEPTGTFYCPVDPVTRGQMASFLARAFGLPPATEDHFPDDDGNLHEDAINRVAEAQIALGYPDGTFRPDTPVTREQMASFLARSLGLAPLEGDRFTDVSDTPHAGNINAIAAEEITLGCDAEGTRFCPVDPVRRDQMASFLGRAREDLDPIVPPTPPGVRAVEVASGLSSPLFAVAPPDDSRVFVGEQTGAVRILSGGALLPEPFLDLSAAVSGGNEQGLLGLAFHPDYATNGRLFVHYTNTQGDTRLVEYRVSGDPNRAERGSARVVLGVDQPFSNHNGGMVAFGPDGYLYLALGDGGSGGDPLGNGQDPSTLLGAVLRIDVDGAHPYAVPPDNPFVGGGGAPEVWAYGLRNPWRLSFDPPAGLLYVADVGQSSWEEVNVARANRGGLNYGWNVLEGEACFSPPSGCDRSGKVSPVLTYPIPEEGCAVIGGHVYRGEDLPWLRGHFFYGDFCGGWVRSFAFVNGEVRVARDWSAELGALGRIRSFGTDADGELYVTAGDALYRLEPDS